VADHHSSPLLTLSLAHYLVQIQHDFVKNHPLLPVIYEFLHEIKSRRCGVAVLKTDVGSEPDIIPMEPLVTPTTNFRIPFTSITYRYLSLLDEFLQNHLSSSTHLADMNTPYNDEWGYSAQNMESTGEPFSSKPSQSAVPPHVSYSTELNKQLLMVRERYSMALGQLSSIYTEFGMRMSDLLHQQASLRPMTESEYYNKMKFVQQKFEMICNQLFNNVCTAITILQSHHQGYSMAHHTDASATLSQIWASQ